MRPKRLISLLVAVCMMITMLPLSAVTAFAADTSTVHEANDGEDIYRYAYKKNEDGNTVTITKFLGPVKPTNYLYDIDIPETLDDKYTVTAIGNYAFYSDHQLGEVTIPQSVTSIGDHAFELCKYMTSVTIDNAATSIGDRAFEECKELETVELGEHITTIGEDAFFDCELLDNVTIPDSVTSIGDSAFGLCYQLKTLKLGKNIETIGDDNFVGVYDGVFYYCYRLSKITIPEKVTTIELNTFKGCSGLTSITLPAGLTSFKDSLDDCPDCVIYYNNDEDHAQKLLENPDNATLNDAVQNGHKLLYLCNVTFDAKGGTLTDSAKVPVYKTEKITKTKANDRDPIKAPIHDPTRAGYTFTGWYTEKNQSENDQPFNVNETAITEDITLYAGWAPVYHPLTVTGGIVTVEKDGQPLNIVPVVTGGKTTYSVPEGAKVTVTLDKTAVPNGKVFDSWSTGNLSLTGQDYKATSITFTMNSGVDIAAQYSDAAPDHTHDTAVYHPLTVTGGTATVEKDGQPLNIVPVVTGDKKTYSVPDGAKVTVTLDQTAVPNGKVFDGWSTGNLSLTGQDYKAKSITFTMNSDVDIAAQYRAAAADDTHDTDTAVCHPLTVTGGIVTVKNGDKDVTDTLTVTTDETTGKKTYFVPDGAEVTVTLDKTLIPEGMVFDIWSTGKFSLPLGQDYKAESITFTMNATSSDVDIAAQYRDATIEDDGPGVLGTAAIIGTAAVGTAVLGYQAYSLGAEFAGKLMALPYFPSNRSALAMMLWEDAGKPMPESELLYPDVGQEERDMDLQHAARWAMENELIPDLNDEGTAPEEMKFFPANPVSKLDVLNAWQKAQELKNN